MRWSFPAVLDDAQRASLGSSVALGGARQGAPPEEIFTLVPVQVSTPARSFPHIQFAGTHTVTKHARRAKALVRRGRERQLPITFTALHGTTTCRRAHPRSPYVPYHHTEPVNHSHGGGDVLDGTHRLGRLSLPHLRYGCATSQVSPATIESLQSVPRTTGGTCICMAQHDILDSHDAAQS
ncbi:hypothetical protein V492_05706 [Pseudogymnoascus sp. VKM F-4246]|nr:hypothetical protein V492_05706 [Pseudogymnoascus sp. VKM F-4246]